MPYIINMYTVHLRSVAVNDLPLDAMPFPAKTDRARILAAAMKQLKSGGMQKLSLRSLASSLNLAPNALYRYFASRSQLEAALTAEATTRVHAALGKACKNQEPEAAVRAMARAYLDFAHRHRFLYQAWMTPCPQTPETRAAHEALWSFVAEKVAEVSGEKQAAQAATMLWAFLHGFVELESAGVFEHGKPLSSFEWGVDAWLKAAEG